LSNSAKFVAAVGGQEAVKSREASADCCSYFRGMAKPLVRFGTKEESNARREREFLALTPWERLRSYLRGIELNPPEEHERGEAKGNFIIWKRPHAVRG